MKNKRNIYCEYAFWEAFFELEEKIIFDRSKRPLWDAFYEFLKTNNIYFDIDAYSIDDSTIGGKNLMQIRQEKGGAGIKFIPGEFPGFKEVGDSDDNILNSVFLTMSETYEYETLSKGLGIVTFNLPMIFSAEHLYRDNGISFDETSGQNWTYLLDLKKKYPSINCCNSLVIADRYLLYNLKHNTLKSNLRPIFDALLPETLDKDILFTICIVAENKSQSIRRKFNQISDLIKELRPNLSFCFNICASNDLHDRSILTNNVHLTVGAGIDVIGEDEQPLKFTTSSLHFPFFKKDMTDKYLSWINNVLKVEKKCCTYDNNYWGNKGKRHHLLDYYYEEPNAPRATFSLGAAGLEDLLSAFGR